MIPLFLRNKVGLCGFFFMGMEFLISFRDQQLLLTGFQVKPPTSLL